MKIKHENICKNKLRILIFKYNKDDLRSQTTRFSVEAKVYNKLIQVRKQNESIEKALAARNL